MATSGLPRMRRSARLRRPSATSRTESSVGFAESCAAGGAPASEDSGAAQHLENRFVVQDAAIVVAPQHVGDLRITVEIGQVFASFRKGAQRLACDAFARAACA